MVIEKKSWLKTAVIQTNTVPKDSIIKILMDNLGGAEKGRLRDVLHASDVTKPDFCPRREAFLDMKKVVHGNAAFIGVSQAVTYWMGRKVAQTLIEEWAGQSAVGNWRCVHCNGQRTMTSQPLYVHCATSVTTFCEWRFVEPVIESMATSTSGSIDVFFDVGTPLLVLTELKILAAEEFDSMVTPLPEHRQRTNLYLRIIAESNWAYKDRINLHEGRVLYVSRGHGKKNVDYGGKVIPFKEYKVARDDQALLPIIQRATQLKTFRQNGSMPSAVCHTAMDKMAKSCTFAKECFSGQFPSQQEALLAD